MEVYPCPICGRDENRRGRPFTDESMTVSHITGSHTGDHAGERGESYRDAIEEVEYDYLDDAETDPAPATAEVRRDLEQQIDALREEIDRFEDESHRVQSELYELVQEQQEVIGELVETVDALSLMVVSGVDADEADQLAERGETTVQWESSVDRYR